jgi:hypothetical protein
MLCGVFPGLGGASGLQPGCSIMWHTAAENQNPLKNHLYHHGSKSGLASGKTSFALLAGVNPNSDAMRIIVSA